MNDTKPATVGAAVREARQRKGMTQADLAAGMRDRGILWDRHQVSRVEHDRRKVKVPALLALEELLGPLGRLEYLAMVNR